MNSLFNWIANLTVVGKVWTALDGKKTYASAGLGILTSLAGLGVEVAPLLAAHNTAGLIALIQGLPHDTAWLSLIASCGLLGLGHKAEKIAAVTPDAVADPAVPTP